MIQKTLFDTPAKLSRKSDPFTSQQSAIETEKKLGPLHELFLQCLITLGRPSTANEVAELCSSINGKTCETNRKRAGELVSELYGRRIVVDGSRRCEVTGKAAQTYKIRRTS